MSTSIADLTDDQLRQAVRGLRIAGYVSEAEFYEEVIAFATDAKAEVDFSKLTSTVAEAFFAAARERLLE